MSLCVAHDGDAGSLELTTRLLARDVSSCHTPPDFDPTIIKVPQ
ncbi:hypothetical protein E2C01_068478 [Portunus trituberculatus]|uniref:Uncharacterized protein n=1 Tax=Portunus trituberculatus TaxID=210409 RepID=A0A5B7HWJ5_PORTR|nr:hypothetical protein [Portunus trituberculatus]